MVNQSITQSIISGIIDGCFDLALTCCSLTTIRINSPNIKEYEVIPPNLVIPLFPSAKRPCFLVGLVDGSWPRFLHFLEEQLHGTRVGREKAVKARM
jgi:hypothetical protein